TSSAGKCTFRLYGLSVNGSSVFTYNLQSGNWHIDSSINSRQPIKSGYATLQCDMPVEAQLLYSFYSSTGVKISEATVFSSPSAPSVAVSADNRSGATLGVAVVNDSDQSVTYTINAVDAKGTLVGSTNLAMNARTNRAAFLTELISSLPSDYSGTVLISNKSG